jgi:DNA-binding GntR family transcriptional regulator
MDGPEGSSGGAVSRVVAALSAEIGSGQLPSGLRLTEAALAERFGVSRGPVREALRQLAAEGLVALARHRGAEVKRLSRAEVSALYQLREVAEGLAARLAAGRAREPGARAELIDCFGTLAAAALARDGAAFSVANARFHATIIGLSGNPYLSETLARLRLGALRAQFRLLSDAAAIGESQAAHARIAEALLAGDGASAEAEMRAHVCGAASWLQSLPDRAFG